MQTVVKFMRAGVVAVLIGGGVAVVTGSPGPGVDAAEPPLTPGQIILASVTAGGVHADVAVESASLSADGTLVAFETAASFGVLEPNGLTQVWVKDLVTGALDVVSANEDGDWGDGDSGDPDLSGDGRYVVFESEATNLVGDTDTNGVNDVYRKDLLSGAITLVSTNSAGIKTGNGESENPVVSDDGWVVAFESVATDLVSPSLEEVLSNKIYARDLEAGVTRLLSRSADGELGGESKDQRVSADGTTVVFESGGLFPPPFRQIVAATVSEPVSLTLVATGADGESHSGRNPDVSGDGTRVVYQAPGGHVDLKDLASDEVTRISEISGVPANAGSTSPAISSDGTIVAFQSQATNLDPGDTDTATDVYVRNLNTGAVTLASVGASGAKASEPVDGFDLSGDGTVVAFRSAASYGQDEDDAGADDIFVKVVSQGSSAVSGLVTDGFSGAPVESACVTLTDGSDSYGPACTDATGSYELPGVPRPATYTALVDAAPGSGHLDRESTAMVARGAERLDLTLDADRDGNGEADESQDNMAVIPSPSPGEYVTLAWPAEISVNDVAAVEPPDPPAGYVLPHGLVSFTASVDVGQTVTLTVYASSTVGVNGYAKYRDGTWSILPAELVAVFEDRVEITLTDGGPGDDDGLEDGTIVDPGGVVALDAAQLIQHVLDELDAIPLGNGTKNPLAASLGASLAAFERGRMNAACNTMNAFANKVAAQAGKKLTADQANLLLEAAADASAAMRCA